MMIPDHLLDRVRRMIAEIGYVRSAWFCRVSRASLYRWMQGDTEPQNGSLAMLLHGVGRWETARGCGATDGEAVPGGTPQGAVLLN